MTLTNIEDVAPAVYLRIRGHRLSVWSSSTLKEARPVMPIHPNMHAKRVWLFTSSRRLSWACHPLARDPVLRRTSPPRNNNQEAFFQHDAYSARVGSSQEMYQSHRGPMKETLNYKFTLEQCPYLLVPDNEEPGHGKSCVNAAWQRLCTSKPAYLLVWMKHLQDIIDGEG